MATDVIAIADHISFDRIFIFCQISWRVHDEICKRIEHKIFDHIIQFFVDIVEYIH